MLHYVAKLVSTRSARPFPSLSPLQVKKVKGLLGQTIMHLDHNDGGGVNESSKNNFYGRIYNGGRERERGYRWAD